MNEAPEKVRRRTVQKSAIRAALERSAAFVSAQELHQALREEGVELGLATVYRNLNDLAAAGEADVLQTSSSAQLFRFCGPAHHHHLYCVQCGRTVEVEAPLEQWVDQVAEEHGFAPLRHTVEIFGLCARCQADPENSRSD